MKIFITGATGLIGKRLAKTLESRDDSVVKLSRSAKEGFVQGDPCIAGPWLDELGKCDAVVHLAGESIFARRWNVKFKNQIKTSRVASTQLIAEHIAKHSQQVKTFVSASAIGFYGNSDIEVTESSRPGLGFMSEVCQAWETAANSAKQARVRVVHPRIGIVLDEEGGALATMLTPFRWFLGGPIGRGKQWTSWIHCEDMTRAIVDMIDNPAYIGPVNCVSPEPIQNYDFCKTLGRVLRRPSLFPVPPIVLRVVLGEIANVIKEGQKVSPKVLQKNGFQFRYPGLHEALKNLLVSNP